jgi:hypothetical protein
MFNHRGQRSNANVWLLVLLITATTPLINSSLSAQSRPYGGTGVTLFANPNYRGESASFRDDTPDLRPYALNDKVSSIEIAPGDVWEICQDINYGNRCQVISNSVPDLRSIGWNDRISSLRRVRNFRGQRSGGVLSPGTSQSLVFYDRPGYRGTSTVVTSQTTSLGSIDNRGGSVEVRGGAWELCDRSGRCATVTQSVSDLSQLGLSGRISSVRPVTNQNYGRGRGYGRGQRDRR